MTNLAVNIDPALVLLDDSENGGQSQPRAFAHALGGEERFKNSRQIFGGYAATGVAHAQARITTGSRMHRLRGGDFVKFHSGGFDDESSALGHGVAGIHREVHQDLIHHPGVRVDEQRCGRVVKLQTHVFAQDALEHFGDVDDDVVQIEVVRLQRLTPAEQEQLAGEIGRALDGLADLLAVIPLRRQKTACGFQQTGLHLNDRENVVEVVRHAAGQMADGFHFLGLTKLLFQLPVLGDVARIDDDESFARLVRDAFADGLHDVPRAVALTKAIFHGETGKPGSVSARWSAAAVCDASSGCMNSKLFRLVNSSAL